MGLLSSSRLREGESSPSCLPCPHCCPSLTPQTQCSSSGFPPLGSFSLSQLPHWDIFPHFQDYGHFHLDLCVLPPHTKKHLGTGLVGLEEIHICPVQAIGIQSFTLPNATKREKRSWELALHFSTFLRGTGTFVWDGGGAQIPPPPLLIQHPLATNSFPSVPPVGLCHNPNKELQRSRLPPFSFSEQPFCKLLSNSAGVWQATQRPVPCSLLPYILSVDVRQESITEFRT